LRICFFGAGAIGGHIAGHLARNGECEVSLVARGENLQAMRERGLKVITPENEFSVPVTAVEKAEELPPQDYVLLSLKAHQVEAALPQIRALIGPETLVLPPTTGIPYYFFYDAAHPERSRRIAAVDPGNRQWDAMPPSQVIGIVYWIGAHTQSPGIVVQDGPNAACPIGELDGTVSPRLRRLSEALSNAGIKAPIRTNIRGDIWIKFVNSLCWNPVALLTLARIRQISAQDSTLDLIRQMLHEADALAKQIGLVIAQSPGKRIAVTQSAPEHKMSMLQDLERGRPLELDVLSDSIRAIAEMANIPTPTIDSVLALAKLRASIADQARDAH
jgi:2-dehydropantoate 2-reductase